MYYTAKERLDIGNKVYTHYMTKEEAAREYQISECDVKTIYKSIHIVVYHI